MTSELAISPVSLAPLLAAKGRVPLLPQPHVPRPRLVAALDALVHAHRLVMLSAGAFAGKTTLLAELAASTGAARVFWYTVDEIDDTPRVLLEGLAHAVSGILPAGDEVHVLAHIVGLLDAQAQTTLLIIDDIHRSAACLPLVERLLRYVPPHAHVLLSGRSHSRPLLPLWHWLEDRNQVAYVTGADLCLNGEERARFKTASGRSGGAWAVEYRAGGQRAIVDGLRAGVLPILEPELRAVVSLLAVLPAATAPLLDAALTLPHGEAERRVARLIDETILVERLDVTHYRLSETARQATLAELDTEALEALRHRAAAALEPHDPAQAAYLFAQAGATERAVAAARRVSWWDWRERQALAMALAALLPPAALCRCGGLALVVAHLRLVERGPRAAHALARAACPTSMLEQSEQLHLLAHCCYLRGWAWSLSRYAARLEALAVAPDPRVTGLAHSYLLVALGIARHWQDLSHAAARALHRGLDLLALAGGEDAQTAHAHVRLLAQRALAVAERRLGHYDEAERLYAAVQAQARAQQQLFVELEIVNNWAVLLQQRGEHARSADMLRQALASPWSTERGLCGLLQASLADALDALGDRGGAAQALQTALADVQVKDVYGLRGHLHAMVALLLVEGEHPEAAVTELGAGAPADHPATLLTQALLREPHETGTRRALEAVLAAVGLDPALHARVCAHLARVCALQGDRPAARKWADAVATDRSYALTAREAAILGPHTRRVRQRRPLAVSGPSSPETIVVRFFGTATFAVGGRPLMSARWAQSKESALLWYALAHGGAGFTREEACADLFPDFDAERGGRALRNLLYELRKLLRVHCGVDDVLACVNGRLSLQPQDLSPRWEADTHTLEEWLGHLRAGDPEAIGDLPLLVAGRYLADLYEDWTRPFRHYWEAEAIHALDLAATHFERTGRPSEALACLRRAIEINPDDAALVRRVMLLHYAMGDLSGLRAAYFLHRRAMRQELDASADPNVMSLYAALTRS